MLALPEGHTCGNYLLMYCCDDKELMKKSLLTAAKYCGTIDLDYGEYSDEEYGRQVANFDNFQN